MNVKGKMLKEKKELLATYKIIEAYLSYSISNGQKEKEADLKEAQHNIDELENIIEFLQI